MNAEKFNLVKFSSEVQTLLSSELDISAGNMEILGFSEKLYKLARVHAYNEGLMAVRDVLERKWEDISEQIDVLIQYED
ncbi:Uncharacterized conserved protein, DUF2164 family [Pseudomonas flavescens]|uniref:Uncharacterized conserved protein, DUF2164 family n=1 Tax=Phytopseudomonas flavescens TaxID=29435 RepID=A0A1G8H1A9_9GAMM|nr:Uncharacterized conserved protein, DUF2164 family [Pseudomonas flavescens]